MRPTPDDDDSVDPSEPLEVDYGSSDDDEDSSDGISSLDDSGRGAAAVEVDADLTRMTSGIVDAYRDYVSEIDKGRSGGSGYGGGGVGGGVEGGDVEEGVRTPTSQGSGGDCPTSPLTIEGDDAGDATLLKTGHEHGQKYRHAWLRSKRVRRGLGIIAVAAGALAAVWTVGRERDAPPAWDQALASREQDLADAMGAAEGAVVDAALEGQAADAVRESWGMAGPGATPPPELAYDSRDEAGIEEEYARAAARDPRWYDRSAGWDGRTYDDAAGFCAAIDGRELCPYEVICPTGSHHIPYGGTARDPWGAWVPTSDKPNEWVQVGEPGGVEGLCRTYAEGHGGAPPIWGVTGHKDEGVTRHVACCLRESE